MAIAKEWQLQGSITVAMTNTYSDDEDELETEYTQAMVKVVV